MSRRFAGWIDRRRWEILAVAVALTAAAGVLAARLPVYGDLSHLLPESTPSVRQIRELERRVRNLGTLLIAVDSDDPGRRAAASLELRRRLEAIDDGLVSAVVYDDQAARRFVWDHRFLYVDQTNLEAARDALDHKIRRAKLEANPLYVSFEDEEKDAGGGAMDKLQDRLDDAEHKKESTGTVSQDGRLQLIVVRTSFEAGSASRAAELVAVVRRIVAEVERRHRVAVGMTGDVMSGLIEHDALLSGMLRAAAVTVLIVAIGLLLFYRSLRAVAALLLALGVATTITFGFTRLAIGHLNLASAFLSSIVVGNGINFGILVVARHLEERRRGLHGVEALAAALGGTFTGTLAAALTATVAYGSLMATNFRGFRHFGVIGGVGMALCWLAAYTVLPAVLAILERRGLRVGREPRLGRLLSFAVPRSRRAARIVASAGIAATTAAAVATAAYLHNPYEQNFRNLRSSTDAIELAREWDGRISKAFGHNISGGFAVAAPSRAAAREVVARLRSVDEGKDKAHSLFAVVRSIDDVLPADQEAKLAILADVRRMIDREGDRLDDADRTRVQRLRPPDDLRPVTEADLPEEMAGPFTGKDEPPGLILFGDASEVYDTWIAHDLLQFTARAQAIELPPGTFIGSANFVFADVIRSVEGDGPRATIIVLVGAVLVIVVFLGWGRYAAITLLCMASGTALMLAGAWLFGLRVNFLDFVALPITIGIGVDYAVNIVARARQRDGDAQAVVETLARTGSAVALCSFTTIVGYGSLLLSANQGIRSFGLAAILGELTCITSALVLAPALLRLGRGADANAAA